MKDSMVSIWLRSKSLIYILIFLSIFFTISCEMSSKGLNKNVETNAIVLFQGNPAIDGCGWVIGTDKEIFHPSHLSYEFQSDSLNVRINYKELNSYFTCGWRSPGYKNIDLISIVKL